MDKPNYDQPVRISEHVYWVGTHDGRDNFQCNPYLINIGGKGVLIDPGSVLYYERYLEKIKKLIDLKNITHIVCQHQDPDVCGNIAHVVKALRESGNTDFRIITHRRTAVLVRHYGDDLVFAFADEFPENKLAIGESGTLEFISTPYLHAPGAIATYFNTDKILFSGDIFGGITGNWALNAGPDYFREITSFHEDYMPSKEILLFTMSRFERYDIEKIAPQHGSIIERKQAESLIRLFKNFECGLFIDQSFRDELQAARKQIEKQNRVMNRELTMAGQFQQSLLPDHKTTQADKQLDIAFLFEPFSQVSGDFLIVDNIDENYLGIMVVDVVDHGVTSGLATIQLKTLYETYKHASLSPAEVLSKINSNAFTLSENDIFFTAVYIIYNRYDSTVTIASAGGVPPIYYNAEKHESKLIMLEGNAIGLEREGELHIHDHMFGFSKNDCLIIQTDGLIDVFDPDGKPFDRVKSQKRFMAVIDQQKSAERVLDDIVKSVKQHAKKDSPFDDDVTVVVFRRR